MSKRNTATTFLENMKLPAEVAAPEPAKQAVRATVKGRGAKPSGRSGLKHIGGYFDLETVERVAVLRARLALDNSGLIKLAIDELYSKQKAKRAFAD